MEKQLEVVEDSVAKLVYQMAPVAQTGCRDTDECDDESATLFQETVMRMRSASKMKACIGKLCASLKRNSCTKLFRI